MEDYYTDPNEFDLREAPIIFEDKKEINS